MFSRGFNDVLLAIRDFLLVPVYVIITLIIIIGYSVIGILVFTYLIFDELMGGNK